MAQRLLALGAAVGLFGGCLGAVSVPEAVIELDAERTVCITTTVTIRAKRDLTTGALYVVDDERARHAREE
jgi:hypothetical protein